jgi:two-component system OmpR family sensor kinase
VRLTRRGGRPLSLRARLLLGVLALLLGVFAAVGIITQAVLRTYLTDRLDSQLTAAGNRAEQGAGHLPGAGRGPFSLGRSSPFGGGNPIATPACLDVVGQSAGTVCAVVTGGTVTYAGQLGGNGQAYTVATAMQTALQSVTRDGKPHTVDVSGVGTYRVLATTQPNGSVVVTGLPLHDVDATVTHLAVVGGSVAGGAIVLAGLVGALIIGLTLRPLRRVAATAGRVAELPLDVGEVALAERVRPDDADPRTEVGRVGYAMNRMLENVDAALSARHASETRVRQFVADASHELRTPLAAIRGYAELTRRTREPVPADVAHALRRVESEAARMTTLVEDLLLLARLDSGRPLEAADVDVTALVVDAVSDAHAAGPDHRWSLDIGDHAVHVTGDQQRLHQVVANLLANARVHTPPETTVTVGVRRSGGLVELTVADDGPGIPPELRPVLFERFARGDGSRSRAAGSTGLGLAIVDAVVGTHGGTVSVDSEPGRTVFTVALPAATLTAGVQGQHTAASTGAPTVGS